MNPDGNARAWVAECKLAKAKHPFWCGTAFVRLGTTHAEIEQAVNELLADILPPEVSLPDIIELVPGCLVLLPEKEA